MPDLQPSNMLLELEDPETVVVKYLERTTPRSQDGEENPDGKLIDFGVGK